MAQAVNDPQQTRNEPNDEHIWPTSIFLNQGYALAFACVKCNGVPKECMNDSEGEVVCGGCAKNLDNVSPNRTVQKMVDKLKIKCVSIVKDANYKQDDEGGDNNNAETEGSNVMVTKIASESSDQCVWNGKVQDYEQHRKQCEHEIIECTQCNAFKSKRKVFTVHTDLCPEVEIGCPLSCGSRILRKEKENHLRNVCMEQLLSCTNDDCKMNIKRRNYASHLNDECDSRLVECEYTKFGCDVKKIRADKLYQHMNESKFIHLEKKFTAITDNLYKENEALKKQLVDNINTKTKEQDKQVSSLKDHVNKSMPTGSIIMWSGTVDNIPSGWSLCDGQNNTPDLRNRFIIGASDEYKIQSIGGNKQHNHNITVNGHKLTVAEMPSHTHATKYEMWVHNKWGKRDKNSGTRYNIDVTGNELIKPTGGNQEHKHTASCSTVSNLPPYFAMCFIIKMI